MTTQEACAPITDMGYVQPCRPPSRPVLTPQMERALRRGIVRLQTERDAKRDLYEWHCSEKRRLVDEEQRDSCQIREWRQILNVRGCHEE